MERTFYSAEVQHAGVSKIERQPSELAGMIQSTLGDFGVGDCRSVYQRSLGWPGGRVQAKGKGHKLGAASASANPPPHPTLPPAVAAAAAPAAAVAPKHCSGCAEPSKAKLSWQRAGQ